jgi:hypothetical protein
VWIDKVKDAKKALKMSNREIAEATEGKLSERDVAKLLNGEYKKPFVDDVIVLGMALKLSTADLFSETTAVVLDEAAQKDTAELRAKVAELTERINILEVEAVWKDKLIKVYEHFLTEKRDEK